MEAVRELQEHFFAGEVAQLIGTERRKVLYYIEKGYMKPSLFAPGGKGYHRLFNKIDIITLAIIDFLDPYLTTKALKEVGKAIVEYDYTNLNSLWISVDTESDSFGIHIDIAPIIRRIEGNLNGLS